MKIKRYVHHCVNVCKLTTYILACYMNIYRIYSCSPYIHMQCEISVWLCLVLYCMFLYHDMTIESLTRCSPKLFLVQVREIS